MKSVSSDMAAHLALTGTTLATCWHIVRTDGVEFFFTDHNDDIVFDGNTYRASDGYTRTAIASELGFVVDNLEVAGAFDDNAITEQDIRAGKFDDAQVYIFAVNWADPTMGDVKLRRGVFGEAQLSKQGVFATELRGMHQFFQQTVGDFYADVCRNDLGDFEVQHSLGRKVGCKVPILPDDVARSTDYALADIGGDPVYMHVKQKLSSGMSGFGAPHDDTALDLTNPGAEAGDTSGWTTTGDVQIGPNPTYAGGYMGTGPSDAPHAGSYYFWGGNPGGGTNQSTMSQSLAVPSDWDLIVDAGFGLYSFPWFQGAIAPNQCKGQVQLTFKDGSGSTLRTDDSVDQAVAAWTGETMSGAIPAGTRSILVTLVMERNTLLTDTNIYSYFDDVGPLTLEDGTPQPDSLFSDDYHNRIFVVQAAGTTAGSVPSYDFTPGHTTVDGSVTWLCMEAWTRSGVVASGSLTTADDHRNFNVDLTEPRAVDGWFTLGTLTWESGQNIGVSTEVKGWTNSGGQVELFLKVPFPVEVGDAFYMWPGCDKLLQTCKSKFDMVLNRQAEDYIPGQDFLTSYAGGGI